MEEEAGAINVRFAHFPELLTTRNFVPMARGTPQMEEVLLGRAEPFRDMPSNRKSEQNLLYFMLTRTSKMRGYCDISFEVLKSKYAWNSGIYRAMYSHSGSWGAVFTIAMNQKSHIYFHPWHEACISRRLMVCLFLLRWPFKVGSVCQLKPSWRQGLAQCLEIWGKYHVGKLCFEKPQGACQRAIYPSIVTKLASLI